MFLGYAGLYPFPINPLLNQNPAVAFPEQYTLLECIGVLNSTVKKQQEEIDNLKKRVEKLEK